MTCYDHGGVEEDDSSILTASVPAAESANFISPTVHIRTVNTYIYIYIGGNGECYRKFDFQSESIISSPEPCHAALSVDLHYALDPQRPISLDAC